MKVLALTALLLPFLISQDGPGSVLAFTLSTSLLRKNVRLSQTSHQSLGKQSSSASSSSRTSSRTLSILSMSQFDITKPVFDLYSLRQVRGDALNKYSSLNQSEPLRINLAGFFALTFLATPSLAPDLAGQSLTAPQTALALAGAVFSASAFYRECQSRSKQLNRLEKELKALSLAVRLPTNPLADSPFGAPATIRQLQQRSGTRVVALTGTAAELQVVAQELSVLGRRLVQASAVVVLIPSDSDTALKLDTKRSAWLAQAGNVQEWNEYFEDLTGNISGKAEEEKASLLSNQQLKWFGLSASGRSFGSGQGSAPEWLELLGQHLRPAVLLDEDDPPAVKLADDSKIESIILQQHGAFYQALTNGSLEDMRAVCDPVDAEAVNKVTQAGGRLDEWTTCLAEGNKPAGMKVADADVTVVSPDTAYSTCIEFPAAMQGATLLAVQKWIRRDDEWLLAKHQTIPWADRSAAGTLICDHRGCVSLVRTPEKRTFGGLIG